MGNEVIEATAREICRGDSHSDEVDLYWREYIPTAKATLRRTLKTAGYREELTVLEAFTVLQRIATSAAYGETDDDG